MGYLVPICHCQYSIKSQVKLFKESKMARYNIKALNNPGRNPIRFKKSDIDSLSYTFNDLQINYRKKKFSRNGYILKPKDYTSA